MKKLILIFTIFIIACSGNLGHKFNDISIPNKDEAIIYFYRPSHFGFAIHYTVKDEEKQPIAKVYPNSYSIYKTKKDGIREFTAKTEVAKTLKLDIKNGNSYFIRSSLKFGILVGRPKFEVIEDEKQFLNEVKNCKISEIQEIK